MIIALYPSANGGIFYVGDLLTPVGMVFMACAASPEKNLRKLKPAISTCCVTFAQFVFSNLSERMPKDNSIKSVLIIGSGPIVIGQACEFDYAGSQAARSIREEGIKVILINSNPATIMTDPMMADQVYLLPLTVESIEQILEENQIDAVLPTMGGQTALNLTKEAAELGVWEKYNVRLIGVDIAAIDTAEDREKFRQLMVRIKIPVAPSHVANSLLEGKEFAQQIGFPLVIRPSFTLGGSGGGFVHGKEDLEAALDRGLKASPMHEVLVEKAVLGWKEYELE